MSDNNLPILHEGSVRIIAQSVPETYDSNALSSRRCADFGAGLLAEIQQQGMSDDLDRRCADFLDKAKRTVKAMNTRRSPITQLFDRIRAEFTGMENAIDPARQGTVPYQIQQARNAFAAKKREEAERARREELMRQQREQAVSRYKQDVEGSYQHSFNDVVSAGIYQLTQLNHSLSVENFDETADQIRKFPVELTNDWFRNCGCNVRKPLEMSDAVAIDIRLAILNSLAPTFKKRYADEVGEFRDTLVDSLPAKKRELESMAKADADEQARLKAELAAREAAATRALDEERRRREQEAVAARQVQAQASEMDGLFGQAAVAAPAGYQPKTAVKKRMAFDGPEGVLAAVSMWWSKEGQTLSVDELVKLFKKQITFCEKLANDKDNPEFLTSPFVRYEEEVKAK